MATLGDAIPTILPAAAESGGDPAADPFGAMVATLLARQVGRAVWEPALVAMAEHGLLDPAHLDRAGMPEVQEALRARVRSLSVRTFAPARQLARWLVERHDGDARAFVESGRSTEELRDDLAGIRGVGPAGADAILLHALRRPTYPVDRGTYRILVRHGWLDPSAGYDEAREVVVHEAGGDPATLIGISAAMEDLAARFCRASGPRCDACPLRPFLPDGGPLGSEDV